MMSSKRCSLGGGGLERRSEEDKEKATARLEGLIQVEGPARAKTFR